MLQIEDKDWFDQTVAFAKKIGLYDVVVTPQQIWAVDPEDRDRTSLIETHVVTRVEGGDVFYKVRRKDGEELSTTDAEFRKGKRIVGPTSELEKNYLKKNLDFLETYACPPGTSKLTKCRLYKDAAPASFYFVMEVLGREWDCRDCSHKFFARVQHADHTQSPTGEQTMRCPKCEGRSCDGKPAEYKRDFNGGLLFHGSHDGFGSGAGPTFAVSITPVQGWALHT